jgi:hypothetical protein
MGQVNELDEDVLHRSNRRVYWVGQLNSGGSLAAVLRNFSDSLAPDTSLPGNVHLCDRILVVHRSIDVLLPCIASRQCETLGGFVRKPRNDFRHVKQPVEEVDVVALPASGSPLPPS